MLSTDSDGQQTESQLLENRVATLETANKSQDQQILAIKTMHQDSVTAYQGQIDVLTQGKAAIGRRALTSDRLCKILLLCIPMGMLTFNFTIEPDGANFRMKEPPLWLAVGFAASVALIVLDKGDVERLDSIGDAANKLKSFWGGGKS
jgi:hypothetical protein